MADIFDNKTVLVTGGTGSIGSEIVRQLIKRKVNKIIVYSIDEIENYYLTQSIRDERLEVILGDIRDKDHLDNVFTRFRIDYIYHAAALKHVVMCERSPIEPVKTNIIGTQNLLDSAMKHGVQKTLIISTDKAAYPTNVMGATKFIAERLVLNADEYARDNQAFSCIRFGNVANSRGSVIPTFVKNIYEGIPLKVTDPNVTRFTMRIDDAVSKILDVTERMTGGEIYILKMKAFRLGDLVKATQKVSRRILSRQIEVEVIGLKQGEKLHEDLVTGLESPYLYEAEDTFLVTKKQVKNGTLKKATMNHYSSKDTPTLSIEELEEMIMDYIKEEKLGREIQS